MDRVTLKSSPPAIQNPWPLGDVSDPVVLYAGPATLCYGEQNGPCEAEVKWFPSRGVRATLRTDEWAIDPETWEANLVLGDDKPCPVHITGIRRSSSSKTGCEIEVVSKMSWIGQGSDQEISRLCFVIPNFADYLGRSIRDGNENFRRGRLEFEAEGWVIRIENLPDCRTRLGKLSHVGGTAITHVGEVFRKDGGSFLPDDAESVLSTLGSMLSFARGAWSQPALLKGYDHNGIVRFWRGCGRRTTAHRGLLSWWPTQRAQDTEAWFPAFHRALNSSEHGEALKQALSSIWMRILQI